MKMNTFLGIAGLLVGLAGCGGSDAATACNPSGTWTVTGTPQAADDCGDTADTHTRVVTVTSGTATIINPEDGSTVGSGPLDASCHMGYVTAVSSPDVVAAGSTDWTFNGTSLTGTISAHLTATADNSMCTMSVKLVGVRQ